ncbi:AMP-binding protein, partial [Bacillus cereus]|uniref:AMP-binding protein n=6 Tax=Bacillaceae TaxID=186817 RepID=UPI001F5B07FE
ILDHENFAAFMSDSKITVATLPPTYAIHLDPLDVPSLQLLVTAGSAASEELIQKWIPYVRYVNAYGPTETSICATVWEPKEGDIEGGIISI